MDQTRGGQMPSPLTLDVLRFLIRFWTRLAPKTNPKTIMIAWYAQKQVCTMV